MSKKTKLFAQRVDTLRELLDAVNDRIEGSGGCIDMLEPNLSYSSLGANCFCGWIAVVNVADAIDHNCGIAFLIDVLGFKAKHELREFLIKCGFWKDNLNVDRKFILPRRVKK